MECNLHDNVYRVGFGIYYYMTKIIEILPNTRCYFIHKTAWTDGKIFKIVTDEDSLHNIRIWLKQHTSYSYLFWKCISTENSKNDQTYYADL